MNTVAKRKSRFTQMMIMLFAIVTVANVAMLATNYLAYKSLRSYYTDLVSYNQELGVYRGGLANYDEGLGSYRAELVQYGQRVYNQCVAVRLGNSPPASTK